jgi:hypothetical protein
MEAQPVVSPPANIFRPSGPQATTSGHTISENALNLTCAQRQGKAVDFTTHAFPPLFAGDAAIR